MRPSIGRRAGDGLMHEHRVADALSKERGPHVLERVDVDLAVERLGEAWPRARAGRSPTSSRRDRTRVALRGSPHRPLTARRLAP